MYTLLTPIARLIHQLYIIYHISTIYQLYPWQGVKNTWSLMPYLHQRFRLQITSHAWFSPLTAQHHIPGHRQALVSLQLTAPHTRAQAGLGILTAYSTAPHTRAQAGLGILAANSTAPHTRAQAGHNILTAYSTAPHTWAQTGLGILAALQTIAGS